MFSLNKISEWPEEWGCHIKMYACELSDFFALLVQIFRKKEQFKWISDSYVWPEAKAKKSAGRQKCCEAMVSGGIRVGGKNTVRQKSWEAIL